MFIKIKLCLTYFLIIEGLSEGSNLTEDVTRAKCNTYQDCRNVTQGSFCVNGYCECDYDTYNVTDEKSPNLSKCVNCPVVGESCLKTNCCLSRDSTNVYCKDGICTSECYFCSGTKMDDRYLFERIAQFILGSALMFTLAILFILFWKACTRRNNDGENVPHCESFISINSIQRLVLLRLQDRPPPYNSYSQNCKNNANHQNAERQISYEEPPPYSSVISSANNDGIINNSFYIGEQPTNQTARDTPNSGQQLECVCKPENHI